MKTEWLVIASGILFLASAAACLLRPRSGGACGSAPCLPPAAAVLLGCAAWAGLFAWFLLRWQHYAASMQSSWLTAFPVTTFYESAVFLALAVSAAALLLRQRLPCFVYALVAGICGAALCLINLLGISSRPVLFLPSLKSLWLTAHVVLTFIAYALFALLAALAAYALKQRDADRIMDLISNLLPAAFVVFTIGGIVFGAIWAHLSWGRFWGWDHKETWALITWVAYAVLLHLKMRGVLSGRRLCAALIINFAIVIFTYVGVNILSKGLHSYAAI